MLGEVRHRSPGRVPLPLTSVDTLTCRVAGESARGAHGLRVAVRRRSRRPPGRAASRVRHSTSPSGMQTVHSAPPSGAGVGICAVVGKCCAIHRHRVARPSCTRRHRVARPRLASPHSAVPAPRKLTFRSARATRARRHPSRARRHLPPARTTLPAPRARILMP